MIYHGDMSQNVKEPLVCNSCKANGKVTEICFNKNVVSAKTGKQVPLDNKTKQPHDCPYRASYGNKNGYTAKNAAPKPTTKISYITPLVKSATIEGVVTSAGEVRTVNKKDGSTAQVQSIIVADDSGEIRLTLWEEDTGKFAVGDRIKVESGFVTVYQEKVQLSKGKFGRLTKVA